MADVLTNKESNDMEVEPSPRYRGLTVAQTEALAAIAVGSGGASVHRSTLKALESKGLIEATVVSEPGKLGTFTYRVYEMPIAEHIAFWEWCSEQEVPAPKGEVEP